VVDAADGWLTIDVKNRFETGDRLELVTPGGNYNFLLQRMIGRDGRQADTAPGSGHSVRIPLPENTPLSAIDEFALLVRHLHRNQATLENG
jgi:putative protease